MTSSTRLLAVGGTHLFESAPPCKMLRALPGGIVKDLGWPRALALEASAEATADLECGDETLQLRFVTPFRLTVEIAGSRTSTMVGVGEQFLVRARLWNRQGDEVEVGKFTMLAWDSSAGITAAVDGSAGEFGFCDTCFGTYSFMPVEAEDGWIEASLGDVSGRLAIVATARKG